LQLLNALLGRGKLSAGHVQLYGCIRAVSGLLAADALGLVELTLKEGGSKRVLTQVRLVATRGEGKTSLMMLNTT
jgi:hypothetical protein